MRVMVTGSRDWADGAAIQRRLSALPGEHVQVTVVHGATSRKARGVEVSADMLADFYAREFGFSVERHPADWGRYGRAAGPIRNEGMLDSGVDLVLAFQRDGSRGTQHAVEGARRRGIPVEVFTAQLPANETKRKAT